MKSIQSIGDSKRDDYHNEFLNTASMLEKNLKQKLGNSNNVLIKTSSKPLIDTDIPEINEPSISEDVIVSVMELKEDLVSLFGELSSDDAASKKIENMIKKIEKLEKMCGISSEVFDPMKNKSGLKTVGSLENAEKVISNTLNYYQLYNISSISTETKNGNPKIDLTIFGEKGDFGFEIYGSITALSDFNGNEALDYVYSDSGGLLTVKARMQGSWQDVSKEFNIDCKVKRYKLGKTKDSINSVFIGEKIIAEGKEKIITALNLNNENIKFDKCRVFAEDKRIIDSIRNLVRINKNES